MAENTQFDWSPFEGQFTHAATPTSSGAYSLSRTRLKDYALIIVEGPDAEKFLQGQCTCDFRLLSEGKRLIGAHCDAKGRMQSTFVAARIKENTIGLRVHHSIAEHALNALKKYIVFSKASISLAPYAILGVYGEQEGGVAFTAGHFSQPPAASHFSSDEHLTCIHHSDGSFELWVAPEQLETALKLTQAAERNVANDAEWQQLRIQRGEADLKQPLAEQLLPQEMNMQSIGAIAFDKGCYTGQEIVARLHYKGKLKKHMQRAVIQYEHALALGDKLNATTENTRGSATVLDFVNLGDNAYDALVLSDDSLSGSNALIGTEETLAKIQWLDLPYAIS